MYSLGSNSLHFRHRFIVKAPLEQVAEFHFNPQALSLLSPPLTFMSFNKIQPLAEGSISDFKMWIGPFPIRWVAMHSNVDIKTGFTDEQLSGPFEKWVHQHTFHALDDNQTEIMDRIEASFSKGLFWGILSRLIWMGLPLLFFYRKRRTIEILQR